MTTTTAKKTAARKAPAKKATKPVATKATVKGPAPTPAEVDAKNNDDTGEEDSTTITIEVEINGTEIELELPAAFEDADPDAIVYMEQEKPTAAFKALIGDDNWTTLKRLGWTARDFRSVVDAWKGAVGLGNG
ncbi:hypothetical protein G6031_09645 [Dietzia sp. CQ4]|uniref:hypothetical protein n=1 Tax=Dietzia sp. (strain CQ4) TaxID=370437 RepID=UPI0015FDA5CA|nr:hypothetical protein [Dietzia sp. CQ4]MBB1034651.1 hypothetical protein [Dietzia sp. CQ4]